MLWIRFRAGEWEARGALIEATTLDMIPALVTDGGAAVIGEEAIRTYLDEHFNEPREAGAHRAKAEKARRRYLEEECKCPEPATR